MKFENFKTIVTKLAESNNTRREVLNSYPNNLSLFIVEDSYVTSLELDYEFLLSELLSELFGDFNARCVEWYLYEATRMKEAHVTVDADAYIIRSLDDYLNFKLNTEVWEES